MLNVALCMRIWREVRRFASQKFRLSPVIQPPTRLQNVLFCLFLLISVVQNACVCTMDFVSAGKNTLLFYVTVCEKIVPRLNKHDDVIEWNFMKIALQKWRAGCAPVYDCMPVILFLYSERIQHRPTTVVWLTWIQGCEPPPGQAECKTWTTILFIFRHSVFFRFYVSCCFLRFS